MSPSFVKLTIFDMLDSNARRKGDQKNMSKAHIESKLLTHLIGGDTR